MKKNKFAVLVIALLLPILAGCSASSKTKTAEEPQNAVKATESVPVDPQKLAADYEANIKQIMAAYWPENEVPGLKEKVLELKAPSQYLDLHLKLVIGLELIDLGKQTSDQAKIDEGRAKIAELASKYSFLK